MMDLSDIRFLIFMIIVAVVLFVLIYIAMIGSPIDTIRKMFKDDESEPKKRESVKNNSTWRPS